MKTELHRVDGTQAFGVGLIASGIARDDSKNKLPVPGTSVTSKLAQMLPIAVSDTLTINEVCLLLPTLL